MQANKNYYPSITFGINVINIGNAETRTFKNSSGCPGDYYLYLARRS
jgi:hypothetical protein